MRSLITLLVLLGTPVGGYFAYQYNISGARDSLQYSICDTPVRYTISTIDPKFKLKEEVLLADIKKAGGIWNETYGKEIFVYDPEGDLDIHFIYDKKQELNEQINSLEGKLNKGQKNLEADIQAYETSVKSFEQRLEAFNGEVNKWNEQGGAPPAEYEGLKNLQKELETEASRLKDLAGKLNIQTGDYNSQVGNLNKTIGSFNAELAERPEEGVYITGDHKIEIYFVPSKNEMIHTLAHEFGHSLGIDHTDGDKKSIMYPYTSQTIVLAQEDKNALSKICARKPIWSDQLIKLQTTLDQYKSAN